MNPDPIVIVAAARTPMGAFQGELKGFAAPELGAAAIRAAVERAKLKPEDVQDLRMGHDQVIDHMFYDGLEDAYEKGRLMGTFAEDCAQKYSFSREQQDNFAIASLQRAQKANNEGWFAWETTPLAIKSGKDEKFV